MNNSYILLAPGVPCSIPPKPAVESLTFLGQRIVGTERHNADSAVEYAACYMRRGGTLPVSNFLCTGNFLLADIQA